MLSGRNCIRNCFYVERDVLYFNTGTFGVCPKQVLEDKIKFLRELELNPVLGYINTMFNSVLDNIKELADRLGGDYENIALLPNVTHGINAVLNSIDVNKGDEMLLTNFTYGAVVMEAETSFVGRGGVIRKLMLQPPFQSTNEIIDIYTKFVKDHQKIKYAIIDHISCTLTMVNPIKEIINNLRNLGVFIIIDGAHCPGQIINLNLKDIDADIYIGNLHKWCFTPRGTAFMAIRKSTKFKIQPTVVSWLQQYNLNERFLFSGTQDFSNYLCIKSAFQFIDSVGGLEAIHAYNTELLEKGIAFLEERWNVTSVKFPIMAPFMKMIPFPKGFEKHKSIVVEMLKFPFERNYYNFTYKEFRFIATAFEFEGELHFRLCGQIFMEYEDFIKFSERVLQWLQRLDNNEFS